MGIGIWLYGARKKSATGYETTGILAHSHDHDDEYNHTHPHNHDHDHEHPHSHSNKFDHIHTHNHDGDHLHSHADHQHHEVQPSQCEHVHTHEINPKEKFTLGTIISLGISGGIVPCYDALLVLLLAIGFHRIALGLAVLIAFSLGLAAVLIIIGILVLKAQPLLERATHGSKLLKTLPALSALLVAAIGLYMALSALIKNGFIILNF
jgi:nickel/cobalt transporter (NicO) family protein